VRQAVPILVAAFRLDASCAGQAIEHGGDERHGESIRAIEEHQGRMIASNVPNFRAIVDDYCTGVMSGEIVAGKLVKGAVKRHLDDLEHGHKRGWWFDADRAARACSFFPLCLKHSIGEWSDAAFELSPWQAFIVWSLFGWIDIQTGLRKYRKALISIARKNGKTTWAAGMELKQLFWDEPDEPGAQVFCVATKEDQAKLLYNEAERMVGKSIFLSGQSRVRQAPKSITFTRNGSFLKPLGSDSNGTDGLNPHCVVMDELHAWREKHRQLKEKLSTGGASRRQPLEIIITTAGDTDSLLWIEEDDYARQVVEFAGRGQAFDDRYFAYVATIDEHDDPLDEANWGKANPNLGVSVKVDYLRDQARSARNAPSLLNQFIRYHANARTEANERAIADDVWQLGAAPLSIQPGDQCHGGIDLGRTNDFTAIALCFPVYGINADGETVVVRWELLTRCWTCSDGRFDVHREPFASWIRDGLLRCCKGNSVDYAEVEAECVKLAETYHVMSWAFDKTYARDLSQRLQDTHGMPIFAFTQSHRFYNEPLRRFLTTELPGGRIIHGNDPVLNWMAANLQVDRNGRDEWMPDKSNPKRKIDGMVASLMAFSECLFAAKSGGWYNATNKLEIG
jgi:phage terminase large subunit-like protein